MRVARGGGGGGGGAVLRGLGAGGAAHGGALKRLRAVAQRSRPRRWLAALVVLVAVYALVYVVVYLLCFMAVSKRARVASTSPTQTDPLPQTRGSRAPLGHTSFYSDMEPGSPFTASPQSGASVAPWPPPPSELKGDLHADLAWDPKKIRAAFRSRRILPQRAKRQRDDGDCTALDVMLSRAPSSDPNGAAQCTAGLHRLPAASSSLQPEPPLCDECGDYGACPVLPPSSSQPLFVDAAASSSLLDAMASRAVAPDPGGGINPCLFTHGNDTLMVYRATTALRCDAKSVAAEFDLDFAELQTQRSLVGVCTMRAPVDCPQCNLIPMECTTWPITLEIHNLDEHVMTVDRHDFVGIEDPRGFSFQGVAYVIGNVGMRVNPHATRRYAWSPQVKQRYCDLRKRRTILVALDSSRRPTRTLMVTLPSTLPTLDDKNVVPLLSPTADSLYLVYSFVPYGLCKLDLATGGCKLVELDAHGTPGGTESKMAGGPSAQNGQVRGSTALTWTPLGYLGLVHRKQQLELGRMYTHKWVLLSARFPHFPIWLSAPFRLPLTERVVAEDIQFAAGALVQMERGTATVSYGVADCFSWFAEVDLPMAEIEAAAAAASAARSLQLLRPVPPTSPPSFSSGSVRVRWEAPIADYSGFAMASRPLAVRLEADPGVELLVIDNEQPSPVYEPAAYAAVYKRIARSNTQLRPEHVHVTVRMHWPPNFQPVVSGKLVVYLPWEFEVIPESWVAALNAAAAEVWVPARFVARGMVRCGVRAEKLHVVNHGAPDGVCARPPVPRAPLAGRPFRFLFHGGLLWRKGVDLLLEAFLHEFTAVDQVELLVHTQYGDAPVQALVEEYVRRAQLDPMAPKVTLLDYAMSPTEMEVMFNQADALVHPSRSEGFGLGIVEAMARGIPVVLPAYGPPTEFVDPATGFFFAANATACTKAPCAADARSVFTNDWRTSSPLMWGDFEPAVLARTMRGVFEDPAAAAARGAAARRSVCTHLTWDRAYSSLQKRLAVLTHYTSTSR